MDLSVLDRHSRIALSFSGGKDSLACVYLLRAHLHRITLYHMDTGDLLPEVQAIVEHVKGFAPNFVHIRGNVDAWIAENGMPTDLLPHSAHAVGQMMGEGSGLRLVTRYDCCYSNLMWPIFARIRDDGNTLVIRGTKRADMTKLPKSSGDSGQGVELLLPIADWSHDQVFAYLRSVGAPINPIYEHVTNSPECARCPAWWNERRAAYMRERHPALYEQYKGRLHLVWKEIQPVLANLKAELAAMGGD